MTVLRHAGDGASYICEIDPPEPVPNPYARVPEIAARLGVAPVSGARGNTVVIFTNGEKYDLFEMIAALLDKIDGVQNG